MFTNQEIDVLLEAVECWETKPQESRVFGSMLGAMFCGKDEESRAKYEAEEAKTQAKVKSEVVVRKERGIMLRAKLIQMKDSAAADALLATAK